MSLKDKTIVVTGGSRGLGLGLVEALVEEGAKVTVVARDRVALRSGGAKAGRRRDPGRRHRGGGRPAHPRRRPTRYPGAERRRDAPHGPARPAELGRLYGDGVDGAPNGIERAKMVVVKTHQKGSRPWASLSPGCRQSRVLVSIWRRTFSRSTASTRRGRSSSDASCGATRCRNSSPSLRPASWRWRHAPRRITGRECWSGSGTRSD